MAKWRCPTGECAPASTWRKASRLHPLIPYKSKRWNSAYRKRVAVEREFGRLKHEWGLKPLRVRGLERVRLRWWGVLPDFGVLDGSPLHLLTARKVRSQWSEVQQTA